MTRILPSDPAGQPRLVGTIALVLQRHFGAPAVAWNPGKRDQAAGSADSRRFTQCA